MEKVPVIDQAAFDRLECNRCGQCCEGFGLQNRTSPLGFIEKGTSSLADLEPQDPMLWVGQLIPRWLEEFQMYVYRCGHLRYEAGLAVCAIYDERPKICVGFPYGRPKREFDRCSWNVDLVDFEVVT